MDDEFDMLDGSAGLGEVLGNFDIAEATYIVSTRGYGRVNGLCGLSESCEGEEVHDCLFGWEIIAGDP
ncbi:MAG: hypothetical protein LBC30_04160 [Puniceicoccales bacterium]|nr:hypothetical protein [Puniceicoccales bacterium]